ncbi:MAG TPA: Mur ligase family protein [Solirubrobacteraceae bacterium]|nr:Mur ligase family protein [Solirubrobacteraceae bacterium]
MSALGLKLRVARAVGKIARASGRGGGTSLPGKVLLRLEPGAIGELAARLTQGSAVISATNGKTTTAAVTATILERAGRSLVHNRAGANMAGGIASTLLAAARPRRGIAGDTGLFEVDEFWLGSVTGQIQPDAVLLANLFRDQLDRYGELETIADRWTQVVGELPDTTTLVLNADDPLIADLGREHERVIYFGVDDDAVALPEMQHASDSKHCRRCGAPYRYDAIYLGHLGHYHCANCGQQRPVPSVRAERITLHGTHAATFMLVTPTARRSVLLKLPGLYNVYNALAATALCLSLGVSVDDVVAGLEGATAAFGRAETVKLGDTTMQILLIKNPAGANEILRTLGLESDQLDVLAVLNDNIADGRDVSWIWDADFELLSPHVRRVTCAGTRAAELAVRLKYAGVSEDALAVVPELPLALDRAVAGAAGDRVYAIPTYTALLALRAELSARGHVARYWEDAA